MNNLHTGKYDLLCDTAKVCEICRMLATNVQTEQNHMKSCAFISIVLKETVAEQTNNGYLLSLLTP